MKMLNSTGRLLLKFMVEDSLPWWWRYSLGIQSLITYLLPIPPEQIEKIYDNFFEQRKWYSETHLWGMNCTYQFISGLQGTVSMLCSTEWIFHEWKCQYYPEHKQVGFFSVTLIPFLWLKMSNTKPVYILSMSMQHWEEFIHKFMWNCLLPSKFTMTDTFFMCKLC